MLDTLFPPVVNNDYKGSLIAKYALFLIIVVTVVRSLIHMFVNDGGAQSIASIPLNTFEPAASAVVILIFALWGLSQLLMGMVYMIVLWRYQKLIPLMYVLIFIEYSMRLLLTHLKPIVTEHAAPGAVGDRYMWLLAIILFLLSIKRRQKHIG